MKNLFMLSLVGLTGCGLYWGGGDDDVSVGQLQEVLVMPTMPVKDLDLLFVIDDSSSMADKQTNLHAAFPRFMDQLTSLPSGLPNLHIGVVTSDMGTTSTTGDTGPGIGGAVGGCQGAGRAGQLQTYEAATNVTGRFISDVDDGAGGRMRNYTGDLRDVFSAISSAGAAGCGFEQHLSAMKTALSPNNTANVGFLRPDANLGVVIVADEDDCSFSDAGLLSNDTSVLGPLQSFRCTRYGVTCDGGGTNPDEMNQIGAKSNCHTNRTSPYTVDVAPFAEFLKGLKADPAQVAVATIAGTTAPFEIELRSAPGSGTPIPSLAHSCQYTDTLAQSEVADPAVRLAEFTGLFGARGAVETICQSDLSLPLTDIGMTMRGMMSPDGCLTRPLVDTAPEVPGVQPLCEVQDLETQLPACDAASPGSDCWRAVQDPNTCPDSPANLRIEIDRAAVQTTQRYAHVRCLVSH